MNQASTIDINPISVYLCVRYVKLYNVIFHKLIISVTKIKISNSSSYKTIK